MRELCLRGTRKHLLKCSNVAWQEKKEAGAVGKTRDEVLAVYAEAKRLEVLDTAPLVLCELLLDENIRDQLKSYAALFKRFSANNLKAQRALLGGIEILVGTLHADKLLPKVPLILKDCYDDDLIEEEVIIEWGAHIVARVSHFVSYENSVVLYYKLMQTLFVR